MLKSTIRRPGRRDVEKTEGVRGDRFGEPPGDEEPAAEGSAADVERKPTAAACADAGGTARSSESTRPLAVCSTRSNGRIRHRAAGQPGAFDRAHKSRGCMTPGDRLRRADEPSEAAKYHSGDVEATRRECSLLVNRNPVQAGLEPGTIQGTPNGAYNDVWPYRE